MKVRNLKRETLSNETFTDLLQNITGICLNNEEPLHYNINC